MAETRAVWGIDIGQYALKAIKLQYAESSDQVVALAFDYIPFPKILSQPDAIPEELIPQALETFLSRNDVQGNLLAISVPGHSALVRFIQLPPVESSKISEIVKYEARQQIPFALDEVIWDYQPLGSGVVESGYMLDAEVGLFAMKREQVMNHLRPFNNAKLEVELIQIAPLALYNVLAFDELGVQPGEATVAQPEHVIVLDMGCDNTTLLVSNGAKIWVRNVPIGGNHFTRALTKEMKLSFAKAEHLKCNATKAPDPRAVFQALRPVFNDYVSEIQRSIGFFSSVNRQAKISKVIGFGNGFKLAGLQKFLQQNLQYEVERPDSFRRLTGNGVLNTPLFQENMLGFAVPYGLALQTLGLTRIRTSLLPPEIATAREVRRKKPWAVLTAAALLSGVALSMIGNGITYSAVHTEQWADAEAQAKALGDKVSGWNSQYESAKGGFQAIRAEAEKLVEGRRNMLWLEVYKAINECLPRERSDKQADTIDIQERNRIDITRITNMHMADLAEWYNTLLPEQKETMSQRDRTTPPQGEGYVFTLEGSHYHHEPNNIEMQGLAYVVNTFLRSKTGLQNWTITAEDGTEQDVGRLGISHARAEQLDRYEIPYDPKGPQATFAALQEQQRTAPFGGIAPGIRGGASPFGMRGTSADEEADFRGGAALRQMSRGIQQSPLARGNDPGALLGLLAGSGIDPTRIPGMNRGGVRQQFNQPARVPYRPGMPPQLQQFQQYDPDARTIWRTDFIVEFCWKPTPPDERTDEPAAAPAEGAPADVISP